MIIIYVLLWLGCLLVLLEAGARIWHRVRYRAAYQPRIYGTYPYSEFVERAPLPLGSRLKKGYVGGSVAINERGLRGPYLPEDHSGHHILLIGESDYFGVKLPREDQTWRAQLQERINREISGEWTVSNGGHPGHNIVQHRLRWDEDLKDYPWDIVLLRVGGNDISQAYAMEASWKPGRGWPVKFLQAMPSGQSRGHQILLRSCLYYLLWGWKSFVRPFGKVTHEFLPENWEQVRDLILKNHTTIIRDALASGAKVGIITPATLSRPDMPVREQRQVEALAEKWESFESGSGPKVTAMIEALREGCPEVPFMDVDAYLGKRSDRVQLYYDQVHWNPKGHKVVADFLYSELKGLGWLENTGEKG